MKQIYELSEKLSNLIAAGEVVERPMNVIKELVENSIDANSSIIKVELEDAGMKAITVLDNGEGINASQLETALKRHATSKIKTEEDLFKIASLGFRGEALPSIASVSDFTITSNDGETSSYLHMIGGKTVATGPAPLSKGTLVEVKKLFFNTPARFRNLGSSYQELNLITEYLTKMAISNPKVSFQLINNGKTLFQTTGDGDLLAVLNEAYGASCVKAMITFSGKNNEYQISGYATNNEILKSNRNSLTILVNGRVIKNLNMQYAITDSYQTILPVGKYPVVVLNIECAYDLIDVNVHPSKLEIRFTSEADLRKLITKTIKDALVGSELLKFQKSETAPREDEMDIYTSFSTSNAPSEVYEEKDEDLKNSDWTSLFDNEEEIKKTSEEQTTFVKETSEQIKLEEDRHFFRNLHYIGQYNETYLIFENESVLYLIDQHAAMERCKYEEITRSLNEGTTLVYNLLIPITLEYPKSVIDQLLLLKNDLQKIGISFDEFGQNTIIVRSLPVWIKEELQIEFVTEIIDHYLNDTKVTKAQMYDELAKSLSCKKSIKAHIHITLEEVEALMKNLDKCNMPYTCPHGRPTIIKFTKTEIEKLFKRINQ